jgi:hypothetical protein
MSTAEEEKLTVWTWESEPEWATANDSILKAVVHAVSPSTSLMEAGLQPIWEAPRSGEGASRVAASSRESIIQPQRHLSFRHRHPPLHTTPIPSLRTNTTSKNG